MEKPSPLGDLTIEVVTALVICVGAAILAVAYRFHRLATVGVLIVCGVVLGVVVFRAQKFDKTSLPLRLYRALVATMLIGGGIAVGILILWLAFCSC